MGKSRLEAFSDGVIAIIITILVLELKIPHGANYESLLPLAPVFSCYVLSFLFVAIYWNNHHHLLQAVRVVNGRVLWANMHLLFWLSLIPFVTGWMGQNHFEAAPVALYGAVLLMAGVAYFILTRTLIPLHGETSQLSEALGNDRKGKLSILLYTIAIGVSFLSAITACALYVLVAIIWIIPDQRFERVLLKE